MLRRLLLFPCPRCGCLLLILLLATAKRRRRAGGHVVHGGQLSARLGGHGLALCAGVGLHRLRDSVRLLAGADLAGSCLCFGQRLPRCVCLRLHDCSLLGIPRSQFRLDQCRALLDLPRVRLVRGDALRSCERGGLLLLEPLAQGLGLMLQQLQRLGVQHGLHLPVAVFHRLQQLHLRQQRTACHAEATNSEAGSTG